MSNLACVILAAGDGTRMKSDLPKVLHTVSGIPMLGHVLGLAESLKIKNIIVIAGHQKELVEQYVGGRAQVVEQKERRGSGHAVMQAADALKNFSGAVLVLCGDMPLLRKETVEGLIEEFQNSKAAATVLTGMAANPHGYGRIIRGSGTRVVRIVEETSASDVQKRIREINTGAYCFEKESLFDALAKVKPDPVKKELYLTDTAALISKKKKFTGFKADSPAEAMGINSRKDLATVEEIMNRRILERWMAEGVTIRDPKTTWIAADAVIGQGTEVLPSTVIEGPAKIGRNCVIGPFAHIRAGVTLDDNVGIGNFVEVVRSKVGAKALVKHLTYIGDAEIGAGVNVGAGTITANFDGTAKHKTVIEEGAQIGSGTIFVAPVRVGRKAKTGAGAVVTRGQDVGEGETVVGIPAKALKKGNAR